MRICRVVKNFPPRIGGLEFHVLGLSIEQGETGHDVYVYTMLGDESLEGKNVRIKKVRGGSVAAMTRKDSLRSLFFILVVVPALVWANWKYRFDIIHVHGDIVEVLFGTLLGRLWQIPQVVTIHAGLNKKRSYRLLARHVFRLPSVIITVSPEIKEDLISLGINSKKIAVIHSGIDYKLCAEPVDAAYRQRQRKKMSVSSDDILIITVGRLHRMKGLEYLIEAVGETLAQFPLKLLIIGDGPERERLKRLAGPYSDRVDFLGEMSKVRVVAHLRLSDIFALPSVSLSGQREGTPTAVMEAMAAGLPIVTTPVGGAKLLVENNINGFIVKEKDVTTLSAAIENLCKNPSLRSKMGDANWKQARDYDWSCVAQEIEKAYENACC
jgi:glycosyltransferase involved in cell wall biosynthesis